MNTILGYVSTLEGFTEGLMFYFIPDWSKLQQLDVWNTAAGQIFFSLSVAYGGQLTLASYNGFKTNCHRGMYISSLQIIKSSFPKVTIN